MSSEFMNTGVPIQMAVRKDLHHLQITRMWFEMKYVLLTPFVLGWNALILWGYRMTFSAPRVEMPVVLFLLLPASLGVSLMYFLLAGFLNKTTIDVTPTVISVKHGPIPVWGNKRISPKGLSKLDCQKEKARNGLYWIDIISVLAKKQNQDTITLLSGLKEVEQAMFIKREVESFLKIEGKA
jgi:hypothetical protein